jgi:hypothetical protein
MPRRIPVSILSLIVLILGFFCVQYGRHAGQRAEIAAHVERGRAARVQAGFIHEGEAVRSHPTTVLHRELVKLEEKLRLEQGFDRATLLRIQGFSNAAQWERLKPASEMVRNLVTHTPAPDHLNSARPGPMHNHPWFIARSLLCESAERAVRSGDLTAAAEDWAAVIDLGRAQWAHSPLPLTLAVVACHEVQVLSEVREKLLTSNADHEVLCRVLQSRLSTARWAREDVHRAIRGEGVALCEIVQRPPVVEGLKFRWDDFGFGAIESAYELNEAVAKYCGVGIADPETVIALDEKQGGGAANLLLAIGRANRERDLARAALLAHAEHARSGRWPESLEELRGLDPETAARLTIEEDRLGRYLAARGEARLVARRDPQDLWRLSKAALPAKSKGRSSH